MKIGLWSDSVNFPSLPLMKISAYHKRLGDTVTMVEKMGIYDKVYCSKTFNLPNIKKIPSEPPWYFADETEFGGTGYAIEIVNGREVYHPDKDKPLPTEIENICPDYSLYPQYSEAYGFLTRGCCNNCSFCIVSQKEGRCSHQVADVTDFWTGQQKIVLLDANILACKDREKLLLQLIASKSTVNFSQGLDARFLDDDVIYALNNMKIDIIHFAFDFMRNEKSVLRGLRMFAEKYARSLRHTIVYILTNYNTTHEEDWYRVCKVRELGLTPDIRIYQKGTEDRFLTDLQRWCNNRILYKSTDFMNYIPRKDGKRCIDLYPEILK